MDVDQILPHILVGTYPSGIEDVDQLKRGLGVSAVLNLQTEDDLSYWRIDWDALESRYRELGIEVRRVPVRDFDPDSLRVNLPRCVEQLDDLIREGHTVYVHCNAGVNRSPSTVIAYLNWIENWDLPKAHQWVTSRRECEPYMDAIRLATRDRGGSPGRDLA